jgi:hypothetical protein
MEWGFGAQGSGFRFQGVGFGDEGLGSGNEVRNAELVMKGLGFRV